MAWWGLAGMDVGYTRTEVVTVPDSLVEQPAHKALQLRQGPKHNKLGPEKSHTMVEVTIGVETSARTVLQEKTRAFRPRFLVG